MGVPPVVIHRTMGFSLTKTIQRVWGTPASGITKPAGSVLIWRGKWGSTCCWPKDWDDWMVYHRKIQRHQEIGDPFCGSIMINHSNHQNRRIDTSGRISGASILSPVSPMLSLDLWTVCRGGISHVNLTAGDDDGEVRSFNP